MCQSACGPWPFVDWRIVRSVQKQVVQGVPAQTSVPLERNGPVLAPRDGDVLVVSVVSVSLSVGVVWCGCYRCCGVACPLLSGGLSSMRCLLYLDVHTRRGTSFGYL